MGGGGGSPAAADGECSDESDESGRRVARTGQALRLTPDQPLPVQFPWIEVGRLRFRGLPGGVVKSVLGAGNGDRVGGMWTEGNQAAVGVVEEFHAVARKDVGSGDFADLVAEVPQGGLGSAFFVQG